MRWVALEKDMKLRIRMARHKKLPKLRKLLLCSISAGHIFCCEAILEPAFRKEVIRKFHIAFEVSIPQIGSVASCAWGMAGDCFFVGFPNLKHKIPVGLLEPNANFG